MNNELTSQVTITINAPVAKVWEALTTPALIKEYLFGTEVVSDWKEGSPITYKDVWQDKAYEDKGVILKIVPEKLLESTYWSSMSGTADIPENYKKVTYELAEEHGTTKLTLSQDNNASEDEKNHTEANWKTVLEGLKKLLEK